MKDSFLPPTSLMILGTCSGAGKSLMTAALCRALKRRGETSVPFKGQNMSNNAWIDSTGGEMAYSQAMQAWAAGLEPTCSMNPILLKPKGNNSSEVIHLGKSVGETKAKDYYQQWFLPGWEAIQTALKKLRESFPNGRLVLEGAGSPVEMNLQHRDLTNLRLAMFLKANCILVADIERGGVFAQIIGTLELLKAHERGLIKGIIINRFRGDQELFHEGRKWIEEKTGIPVLGVMPWLKDIYPPEDSLDLIERYTLQEESETKIAVIKLDSISNFSDMDPLEIEPSVNLYWIKPGDKLGSPDAMIIPGSKQTISDLKKLKESRLADQIIEYARNGGIIFGICGGFQMLGNTLEDPYNIEDNNFENDSKITTGLNLLPIHTIFNNRKIKRQRETISCWPNSTKLVGYELHYGETKPIKSGQKQLYQITKDKSLGWVKKNNNNGNIAGCYLHGIFENDEWRRNWINQIRLSKSLCKLKKEKSTTFFKNRETLLERLADSFEKNINIDKII